MPSRRRSPSRTEPGGPEAGLLVDRVDPWADAVAHLRAIDPRWHPLIDRIGPCRLRPRRDRFGILVRAIIGQQISTKAASSINRRLLDLQGSDRHLPDSLLALGIDGLRSCGLSGVKAGYVRNLSEAVASGSVPLSRIGRLRDAEIVSLLTGIKGIGPWTAEMFLVFALNRPDVLSVGDLGVRAGIRSHFGLDALPTPRQCLDLAEPWRPFRSVAMWYLWRGLDSPPPAPSVQAP
ncbi:DNA-3-methyladenine glycosylase family protein [Tautonia sociabilis]|uniref:DNA-3-methyladenine glycosylase II n=1 Tax=Tautonia sociabilis TaxID=2080755 RepID=A0A432MIM5_9BACT|nr:DNA-3-methyladenine glycosylase [Tautonia sociabilis]RUL87149.1 DNA-3-methyladenine glycosylase 2 family protein [Tautonia sociabilis]